MASSNTTNENDPISLTAVFGPLKSIFDQLIQQNRQFRAEIDQLKQQNRISMDEQRRNTEQIRSEINQIRAQHVSLLEQLEQLTDLYRIYNHELHRQPVKHVAMKWKQQGTTIAGGNGQGNELNQLKYPYSLVIDDLTKTISIADYGNCRIMEWKLHDRQGQVIFNGYAEGIGISCPRDIIIDRRMASLIFTDWISRQVMRYSYSDKTHRNVISNIDCNSLIMDKDGSLYVSDWKNDEIKRWKRGETEGIVIAGANGKGNQMNQFDQPTFIFVDDDYALYVSDFGNHRVMKWMKDAREGIVVAGGNGQGNQLNQLSHPQGILVDRNSRVYIADQGNDRIVSWNQGANEGVVIVGGHGKGREGNQLDTPTGLAFDREENLYVVDQENHRIQHFEIDLS